MLFEVGRSLAGEGWTVSVIARTEERLRELERAAAPGRILPIPLDYRDLGGLRAALSERVAASGRISLAVVWAGDETFSAVAQSLESAGPPVRCFRVLGSRAAAPDAPGRSRGAWTGRYAGVLLREIILGFVLEADGSRWLSHGEIARGVLQAVAEDREESVVGVVRPWERRP